MSNPYSPVHPDEPQRPTIHQRSPSLPAGSFDGVTVDALLPLPEQPSPFERSSTPSKDRFPHPYVPDRHALHSDGRPVIGGGGFLSWLPRGASRGHRRWIPLFTAAALLWLWASYDSHGEGGLSHAASAPKRRIARLSSDGLLAAMGVKLSADEDGGEQVDPRDRVPEVDRTAIEKLRLLEIHLGLENEEARLSGGGAEFDDDELVAAAGWRDSKQQRVAGAGGVGHRPGQGQRPALQFPKKQTDPDSPPLVASIPDPGTPNKLMMPGTFTHRDAELLDRETCPERLGAPCAFLVPAWLPDQETKMQQHVYQLGLLALALNRTLVLPNVSKNRLGACYANPFELYYTPTTLTTMGINTLPHRDFIEWAERRSQMATAQVVTMIGAKPLYSHGAIEIDSAADPTLVPGHATRKLCLNPGKARLDFASHSPLSIFPPGNAHKSEAARMSYGESVVHTLRSTEVGRKSSRATADIVDDLDSPYSLPNVLALNYELKFPFMSPKLVKSLTPTVQDIEPFTALDYAEPWKEVAEMIVDSLSPFVAVHWKTEGSNVAHLTACVDSLVKQLEWVHDRFPNIRTIYLATDYPIDHYVHGAHGKLRSLSFEKMLKREHHAAFKRLLAALAKQLPELDVTAFGHEESKIVLSEHTTRLISDGVAAERAGMSPAAAAEAPELPAHPTIADLDEGLVGIIDKMVARRAEFFVAASFSDPGSACAKKSSYYQEIVASRKAEIESLESEEEGLMDRVGIEGHRWNEAVHFSTVEQNVEEY